MTMIWLDQLRKFLPTKLTKMTTPNGFWSQKNKTETDLVTLTEDPNPWLAPTSSVMTTSLDSLPGSFTLPSNFSSELSKDIWLSKPAAKQTSPNLSKDLDGWLLVPATAPEPEEVTSAKTCTNPLDEWERQSLTCNWIINDNNSTTSHSGWRMVEKSSGRRRNWRHLGWLWWLQHWSHQPKLKRNNNENNNKKIIF